MVKSRLPSQNPMVKLLVDVYRSKFLNCYTLTWTFLRKQNNNGDLTNANQS